MNISTKRESGTVLVTTLVITGLVTIAVAAVLMIVNRQNYFSARSQTWSSEIPIAEAGIEEAMAHINSRPVTFETNGWTRVGTNVVKRRDVGDGYFYTAISTQTPPVIVSVGFGRIPLQTNYTQRTVMVLTRMTRPYYGIVARGAITMSGSGSDWPWVDAFDSSDPNYSTIGPGYPGGYDSTQRKDTAGVATLSNLPGAINTGSGEIWGYASTGPGGTVVGTVGDGPWNLNFTGPQTNHVRDDFNGSITNAVLPTTTWQDFPGSRLLSGTGDFKYTGKLDLGFAVQNNAKVRLWVDGDVQLTGSGDAIDLGTNASLELYVSGAAHFGGKGVLNGDGLSTTCKLIGLPTCASMKYTGNVDLIGVIYAPNATVTIGGGVDVYGSLTANILNASGSSGIHYDEALGKYTGPPWTVYRWEEL